ncbi:hypothetical protein FB451DRAFT_1413974 [Mycena latifolia]|nr:hypothetical protein FB451DRAFT_1413974 [Mycena latifolia]
MCERAAYILHVRKNDREGAADKMNSVLLKCASRFCTPHGLNGGSTYIGQPGLGVAPQNAIPCPLAIASPSESVGGGCARGVTVTPFACGVEKTRSERQIHGDSREETDVRTSATAIWRTSSSGSSSLRIGEFVESDVEPNYSLALAVDACFPLAPYALV